MTAKWRAAASILVTAFNPNIHPPCVLMIKRAAKSTFMPNAWVFPGGVLQPSVDTNDMWGVGYDIPRQICHLPIYREVAEALSLPSTVLARRAMRVCALRELYEETGLLILTDGRSTYIISASDVNDDKMWLPMEYSKVNLQSLRDSIRTHSPAVVRESPHAFLELLASPTIQPLTLALDRLTEWSDWLTPIFNDANARRYDTVFYAIDIYGRANIRNYCREEVQIAEWTNPLSALHAGYSSSTNVLPPPQLFELSRMVSFGDHLRRAIIARRTTAINRAERLCPQIVFMKNAAKITALNGDVLHISDGDDAEGGTNVGLRKLDMSIEDIPVGPAHRIIFQPGENNLKAWTHWQIVVNEAIYRRFDYILPPSPVPPNFTSKTASAR